MKSELIKMYADNPSQSKIDRITSILRSGGLVIYPTDTVYGIGCDIFNQKAIERVRKIKQSEGKKVDLSFICYDLSHISEFTRSLPTPVFKSMKKNLPGPFTYILNANNKVPKLLNSSKKTVGIRIPDNNIPRELVRNLGNPIVTTSIKDEDEVIEYSTDPELIYEKFYGKVEVVIDGGYGNITPSTVVDYTDESPLILREGLGDINLI